MSKKDKKIQDISLRLASATNELGALVESVAHSVERLRKIKDEEQVGAVALVKYLVEHKIEDTDLFLRLWYEGSFDTIRREWKDVPETVFK